MLRLPDVTLVCADSRTPALALAAMKRCMAKAEFGDAILFTPASHELPAVHGLRVVPVALRSVAEYSRFMLSGLLPHIQTKHVLVAQWDSWILQPAAWTSDFLEYDYLGALFSNQPPGRQVGNGGFSLRSRRLLKVLGSASITLEGPEDAIICWTLRDWLERDRGLRFAPSDLASRFAFERVPSAVETFGFHGLFNFGRVLDDAELTPLLRSMPDEMMFGKEARDLGLELLSQGRREPAGLIVRARRRKRRWDSRSLGLYSAWFNSGVRHALRVLGGSAER